MNSAIMRLLVLMLIFLSAAACEDFGGLEEGPKTFISPNSFYKNADDFDSAIKGIYNLIYQSVGFRPTEIKGTFAPYMDQPESVEQTLDIWRNNPAPEFYAMRSSWQWPYDVINNANMILHSLESVDLGDAESDIEAETKFLRGFAYFELVQLFGDVPLRREPVTSLAQTQIGRTAQTEIYDLIIHDLIDAESALDSESPQVGRVNKFVAKALLARVYLTSAGNPMNRTENYDLAFEMAVDVISNGSYSLVEDYANVFKNSSYTSETIWGLLYQVPELSNGKHVDTAPTGNQTAIMLPSDDFINSFPTGDRRREWGIKDGFVTSEGDTVISRTYFNKFIDEQLLEQQLPPTASQTDFTFPLIRLAEMYLIAAEAENEMNGPNDAYQYINEVRRRARIDENNSNHVPDLSGMSQGQLREAIYDEREWELYAELHSWFDLKRTDSFDDVQQARGSQLVVPIGPYNHTWLIPDFEVLNNDIEQNPVYGG